MAERDDDDAPVPAPRGRGRQLWVGVFVLVALIGGLGVLFTMTDPAMFRGRYIVSTVVEDAGGIRKGDPVRMKGVVIGRVLGFTIDLQKGNVTMKIEIEGEYSVPRDSTIEVKSKNIYGEMTADVLPGTSAEPLKSGDVLPGRLKKDLFSPEMAEKANDVMTRVQRLLADEILTNVQDGTTEMKVLMRQLNTIAAEQKVQIATIEKGLNQTIASLDKTINSPELQAAIKRSDELSQRLAEATASLDKSAKSLEVVMARVEKGEGSMGKLLKDNEELYKNMNDSIANANKLLIDFREHPRRYVKLSFF